MPKKANLNNRDTNKKELTLLEERILNLEKRRDKLQYLCQNLDPFRPLSPEEKEALADFNLHLTDDPYRLTALLITLMEDTIAELQSLGVVNLLPENPTTISPSKTQ